MRFRKKNFLLLGYQTAALSNLKTSLEIKNKNKVKLYSVKKFSKNEIKKISILQDKNIHNILKYLKNYNIILGTSEFELESNLANFFYEKKINFYCYVDSNVNMKIRFKNFLEFPKNIIALNKIVITQIKKVFLRKLNKTKFYNLNMPYQNDLKKKYSNLLRSDEITLYLSNDYGIKEENLHIKKLTKDKNIKKVYIIIHPREEKNLWLKKFKMEKKVKIFKNINFYSHKKIKKVYGISTMALINYKFAGFEVFYFNSQYLRNNPIIKFLRYYKIQKVS